MPAQSSRRQTTRIPGTALSNWLSVEDTNLHLGLIRHPRTLRYQRFAVQLRGSRAPSRFQEGRQGAQESQVGERREVLTDMSENLAGVAGTGTPGGGEKAGAIHVRELGYDRANP